MIELELRRLECDGACWAELRNAAIVYCRQMRKWGSPSLPFSLSPSLVMKLLRLLRPCSVWMTRNDGGAKNALERCVTATAKEKRRPQTEIFVQIKVRNSPTPNSQYLILTIQYYFYKRLNESTFNIKINRRFSR